MEYIWNYYVNAVSNGSNPEWVTYDTHQFAYQGPALLAFATLARHTLNPDYAEFGPFAEAAIVGVRYYKPNGEPEAEFRLFDWPSHFRGENVAFLRLGVRVLHGTARGNFLIFAQ